MAVCTGRIVPPAPLFGAENDFTGVMSATGVCGFCNPCAAVEVVAFVLVLVLTPGTWVLPLVVPTAM